MGEVSKHFLGVAIKAAIIYGAIRTNPQAYESLLPQYQRIDWLKDGQVKGPFNGESYYTLPADESAMEVFNLDFMGEP